MSTAVIHFEDIKENVAEKFRGLLENKGLVFKDGSNLRWKFVSYHTSDKNKTVTTQVRGSTKVAKEAAKWLKENHPDRLVLITDLTPVPGGSMETYGLEVLAQLVHYMSEDHDGKLWVANVQDLVKEKKILVVFLTIRGPLEPIFSQHKNWKNINISEVGYPGKGNRPTVSEALEELQGADEAVVYADRGKDENWASDLIAEWVLHNMK